jgi:hypothetical protein
MHGISRRQGRGDQLKRIRQPTVALHAMHNRRCPQQSVAEGAKERSPKANRMHHARE